MSGLLLVAVAALSAEAALSQEFKDTAAATAARWDSAFNAGDPSKVAQGYTKNAVILPAGGQPVTGPQGAEALFGGFVKGGVKNHKITVQGGEQKGELGYAYGRWEADAGGKKLGGHWTNVLMNEGGQWRTALHTWTLEQ
ncbi:YybH family protein [Methylobacterium oryzisoli]|uniref:YybH family protein n=1 Tax=Methylobacterium oryzisoli TaxID=3385502 RepID=UPI003891A274